MHKAILIVCASLLIGYALLLSFYAKFGVGNMLCIALGLPLLMLGLFKNQLAFWLQTTVGHATLLSLQGLYALFILCLLLTISLMVISHPHKIWQSTEKEQGITPEAVIVLGAGLRGDQVSKTLALRLDKTLAYLADHPNALCVVSGGQGSDETIPESQAMSLYLQQYGISKERILQEDRSTNTNENIQYSKQVLQMHFGYVPSIVVITSDYHLWRGVALAKGAGFQKVQGYGSKSLWYVQPLNVLREMIGIAKDGLLGRYIKNSI